MRTHRGSTASILVAAALVLLSGALLLPATVISAGEPPAHTGASSGPARQANVAAPPPNRQLHPGRNP